jgi:hypothetical protein
VSHVEDAVALAEVALTPEEFARLEAPMSDEGRAAR